MARLLILHIYRVLYLVGAPCARAFAVALWLGTAFAAVAAKLKRMAAAFLGWQNQKLTRGRSLLGWEILPDLRNWHVTLGAQLPSSVHPRV